MNGTRAILATIPVKIWVFFLYKEKVWTFRKKIGILLKLQAYYKLNINCF